MLKSVLAMRRHEGMSDGQPAPKNMRYSRDLSGSKIILVFCVFEPFPAWPFSFFRYAAYKLLYYYIHGHSKAYQPRRSRTVLPNCVGRL